MSLAIRAIMWVAAGPSDKYSRIVAVLLPVIYFVLMSGRTSRGMLAF